jgi:upstream activation factor subunit UAF30
MATLVIRNVDAGLHARLKPSQRRPSRSYDSPASTAAVGSPGRERPWLRPGPAGATPVIPSIPVAAPRPPFDPGEPMPSKTAEQQPKTKTKAGGGKSNALQKPLQPSPELAAVVGPGSLPRTEEVSKVWDYIRSHNLQNPENRREILADGQTPEGVRQGQGDHVRDEQAPGPAPDVTALPLQRCCPAGSSAIGPSFRPASSAMGAR